MVFDSHTHLPQSTLNVHIVSATPDDWETVIFSNSLVKSIGIHPWAISEYFERDFQHLKDLLIDNPDIQLGETGLDFCENRPNRDNQSEAFKRQLQLAVDLNRVVTIHSVKAWDTTLALLKEIGIPKAGGVVHAFRGSSEIVSELNRLECYISVGTRELSGIRTKQIDAIKSISLNHLLIESDGRDDCVEAITLLSSILKISELELIEQLNNNSSQLFDIQC